MITCSFCFATDVHTKDQDCKLVLVLIPALSPEVNLFARLRPFFPDALVYELHLPAVAWEQTLITVPLLACFYGTGLEVNSYHLSYDYLEENPYERGFDLASMIDRDQGSGGLFFSTLNYLETDLLLNGLIAAGFDAFPLLGGMLPPTVSGDHAMYVNGRALKKGVSILSFGQANLRAQTAFSQGFIPFGPSFRITAAGGDEILEIEHAPALTFFKTLFERVTKLDPRQLLLGAAIEVQSENGTFCRKIIRTEERRGSVFVAGEVPSGATFRFFRGDVIDVSEQSRTCLRQLLSNHEEITFILAVSSQNRLNKFRETVLSESDPGAPVPVCCLYLPAQVLIRGGTRTTLNNLSFQCLSFTEC